MSEPVDDSDVENDPADGRVRATGFDTLDNDNGEEEDEDLDDELDDEDDEGEDDENEEMRERRMARPLGFRTRRFDVTDMYIQENHHLLYLPTFAKYPL